MVPIGRMPVRHYISSTPLFSHGTPAGIRGRTYSTTFMQGTTVRWCRIGTLIGVIQVAGASIFPRSGIQVFSEEFNKRAI